jgi:hypothetical protein
LNPIEMLVNSGAPLTEQEIIDLETELHHSLPIDYAEFLRNYNGGTPHRNIFPIRGYSLYDEGVLAFFFGTKRGETTDVLTVFRMSENRVPQELLPIGADVFGNLICLTVAGPNRGKVYWWFHEEEADEKEPPTYDNIYFVANSFTDLLNSLREMPDVDC